MSKTDTVTLPSRPLLADGSKNPDYDPTLDPGSSACQYERFFSLRPQVRVHIRGDHENPQDTKVGATINGYQGGPWAVNADHVMAEDFAERLIERGIAWRVG